MKKLSLKIVLMLVCVESLAVEKCALPKDYVEASPLIRVKTKAFDGFKNDDCAVISYMLVEKDLEKPGALIASNIEVLSSSNIEYGKVAEKALKKWLFLSKGNSKDVKYYYKFSHND